MLQLSVALRNARLDVLESVIGTSPVMKIFGNAAIPPDTSAADDAAAVVLSTILLPADWLDDAVNGWKRMPADSTWQDQSADADGNISYWRLYQSDGVTVHMQGRCGLVGSSAEMIVDAIHVGMGEYFTIETFSLFEGND